MSKLQQLYKIKIKKEIRKSKIKSSQKLNDQRTI